jgi:hypothetical protein
MESLSLRKATAECVRTPPPLAELSATVRERAYKPAMMISEIALIKIVGDATSASGRHQCWL